MSTAAIIPITITPEAAAFVRQLGYDSALERMLEYTKQEVPGLCSIIVKKEIDYTGEGLGVTLEAHRLPVPDPMRDATDRDWAAWKRQHFSPEVTDQFCLMSYYTDENGHGW